LISFLTAAGSVANITKMHHCPVNTTSLCKDTGQENKDRAPAKGRGLNVKLLLGLLFGFTGVFGFAGVFSSARIGCVFRRGLLMMFRIGREGCCGYCQGQADGGRGTIKAALLHGFYLPWFIWPTPGLTLQPTGSGFFRLSPRWKLLLPKIFYPLFLYNQWIIRGRIKRAGIRIISWRQFNAIVTGNAFG